MLRFLYSSLSPFIVYEQSELKIFLISGGHSLHDGTSKAEALQRPDTLNGSAAGRADRILKLTRVPARFQDQQGRARSHLGGKFQGLLPGQTAATPPSARLR